MFSEYNEVLTVTEVAEILMCGRNRVYSELNHGNLRGFRLGKNTWRIPRRNLEAYIVQKCRSNY